MVRYLFILTIFLAGKVYAQQPFKHFSEAVELRYSAAQPVINYTLTVNEADLSSYEVEINIRNAKDTFHVAMITHPEYNDRYWRFVEGLTVETKKGTGKFIREDSALWKIFIKGGEAVLHYRIHLPPSPSQRPAWRPFLSPTGGLVGGHHSFMYVTGATLAPSHVTLKLPKGWNIATGLQPTSDPKTFFAPTAWILSDCPILIGQFRSWQFKVADVPHRIVYWSLPGTENFDTTKLVSSIHRYVSEVHKLFGRFPYREYSFLLQDGAYGALEHLNSVTIGAPASQLKQDMNDALSEIAHEYFHTWNLMRIRPVEYSDITYKDPELSKGLWWSEGLTMFYADLLRRRAGLPAEEPLRITLLENLIKRYFGNAANHTVSPEKVSMAEYAPPGWLGDYFGSTHLQGQLLGTMLDLIIRKATANKNSIDDVMRKMMEQFSGEKGFTGKDIEKIIEGVCHCDVHSFFENYVRGNKEIDFNKYLQLIGMEMRLSWKDAVNEKGTPIPDLKAFAFEKDGKPILGITDPQSCWCKAGLHSNDELVFANGIAIKNVRQFRMMITELKIGDTMHVEVQRPPGLFKTTVRVSGFKEPLVAIKQISNPTELQQKLYAEWSEGK